MVVRFYLSVFVAVVVVVVVVLVAGRRVVFIGNSRSWPAIGHVVSPCRAKHFEIAANRAKEFVGARQ